MWRKFFFFLVSAEIIFVIVIFKYTNKTKASIITLSPNEDGATLQWTPSDIIGNHYSLINEAITYPDAGDIKNYIFTPAIGKGGGEQEDIVFTLPKPFEIINSINLYFYAQDLLCLGIGKSPCDNLSLVINNKFTLPVSIPINVGAYDWTKVSFDTSIFNTTDIINYLNSLASNTLTISLIRNANGDGVNNDEVSIATVYLEITTLSDKSGGIIIEPVSILSVPIFTAKLKSGGEQTEKSGGGNTITNKQLNRFTGGGNSE